MSGGANSTGQVGATPDASIVPTICTSEARIGQQRLRSTMLKATIREYMGAEELDRKRVALDPTNGPITIGRSSECSYSIGGTLGEWARGIARIQATIAFDGEQIVLIDGSKEKASTNGIWVHGDQIKGAIALTPGLELTLFKSGRAKVCLLVSDGLTTDHGNHQDTYTGEDLTSILQEQIEALKEQGKQMGDQIGALAEQLAAREKIDQHQTETLVVVQRRINRVVMVLLGTFLLMLLSSGWLGTSQREELVKGGSSIAVAVALGYLKLKEKELEGVKP